MKSLDSGVPQVGIMLVAAGTKASGAANSPLNTIITTTAQSWGSKLRMHHCLHHRKTSNRLPRHSPLRTGLADFLRPPTAAVLIMSLIRPKVSSRQPSYLFPMALVSCQTSAFLCGPWQFAGGLCTLKADLTSSNHYDSSASLAQW